MRQTRKVGKIRRRLMAGLFCISLLSADVAAVIPVWASELVEAAEQAQAPDDGNREGAAENPGGDKGEDKVTSPDEEKDGNGAQNPDEGKDGEDAENTDEGKDGEDAENTDEGKDGEDAENTDEGKDGEDAQNPDEGKVGDDAQNPEDKNDGDEITDDPEDTDVPDGSDTPEEEETDSVSDNSVSENDVEVMGEVRALAVPADAIASGISGNISWELSKDGILTISGTGDYELDANEMPPWVNNIDNIHSVVVDVSDITSTRNMFNGLKYVTQTSHTDWCAEP